MASILMANGGWAGGPWFLLFPLLWGAVLVSAFLMWRGRDRRWTGGAEEILAERYARGEISADELQQRRDELRRKRR